MALVVSAEAVDAVIRELEKDVERQVATAGSAVKGVAAERNMLSTAERARDLCDRAVAGEKDELDRIFGGTCERVGRLRLALERVTISAMHAKDPRWNDLRKEVEKIEAVLKDLGTFKPWRPPSVAEPGGLRYGARRRYSPGRHVSLRPELEGGDVEAWEVEPPLPRGLQLAPATGVIAGTLAAGELVEEASYRVTARNAGGEASFELVFAVAERPPHVAYGASPEPRRLVMGEDVRLSPELHGTSPARWELRGSPLPRGLKFDEATGEISGRPAEAMSPVTFQVVAMNSGGEGAAELSLEVLETAPASLAYREVEELVVGEEVRIEPRLQGSAGSWEVVPPLPAGLSLDEATGAIFGRPERPLERGSWRVTASNSAGQASCELAFAVKIAPPADLAVDLDGDLAVLRPADVAVWVKGLVEEFTVSPALPAGLQLDARTGRISGTPEEPCDARSYTLTARNASGELAVDFRLAVVLLKPELSGYPQLQPVYKVGDSVQVSPAVDGLVSGFACEPALPEGLALDEASGAIVGTLTRAAKEGSYRVTASNDKGESSVELQLRVAPAAPAGLSYSLESPVLTVGVEVRLEPSFTNASAADLAAAFSAQPALPEGLVLDRASGAVVGAPAAAFEEAEFSITARNESGECRSLLRLAAEEAVVAEAADARYSRLIDEVEDLSDLPPDPRSDRQWNYIGNYMVWMVHRAHLNDPELEDFSFNNMQMPEPHIEERIAPKLVKAIATNTHIRSLRLLNSNLMKAQGLVLAESLKQNSTLQVLDLSSNNLDAESIREMASSLADNPSCSLQEFRVSPQRYGGGKSLGTSVEEQMGRLMERSNTIVKLGFECHDANWRNVIDRALLRNNDFARRRRSSARVPLDELVPAEERSLGSMMLLEPPPGPPAAALAEGPQQRAFWGFLVDKGVVPNADQLRSFAQGAGAAIKYAEAAPTLKACRALLLDAACGTEVNAVDRNQADTTGEMRRWSQTMNTWSLDVWASDGTGKRYAFKTDSDWKLQVSPAWTAWLRQHALGA